MSQDDKNVLDQEEDLDLEGIGVDQDEGLDLDFDFEIGEVDLDIEPEKGNADNLFLGDNLDSLVRVSIEVKGAIDQVINKCWYTDEFVMVNLQQPMNQAIYEEYLIRNLGEDFDTVVVQAQLMMTADDLLTQVMANVIPEEEENTEEVGVNKAQDLNSYVGRLHSQSRELLIQIRNAHELGEGVLEGLAGLVEGHEEMVTPHLVLWGEMAHKARLQEAFKGKNISLTFLDVPAFSSSEIKDYISEQWLTVDEDPLPLSDFQIEAITKRSEGVGPEVDRLTRQYLFDPDSIVDEPEEEEHESVATTSVPKKDESKDAGSQKEQAFPVLHVGLALALVVILAVIFLFWGDEGEELGVEGVRVVTIVPADDEAVVASPEAVILAADAQPTIEDVQEDEGAGQVLEEAEATIVADTSQPLSENGSREDELIAEGVELPVDVELIEEAELPEAAQEISDSIRDPEPGSSLESAIEIVEAEVQPLPEVVASSGLELEDGFLSFPDSDYVIQLFGTFTKENAADFIESYSIDDSFYLVETNRDGRAWYTVIYGSFSSRALAVEKTESLSEQLREGGPWIRPMADIRAIIVP